MRFHRSAACCIAILIVSCAASLRATDDWLPLSSDDLKYKDPSGVAAVILYLEDDTDDTTSTETFYIREKILTDEGKKYGDVELPYVKDFTHIDDIKARVIQPDGSISDFSGQIYDKTVVKSKTVKVLVRSFALPGVQPGTIIEYRYKQRWGKNWLLGTVWRVQQELPVRKAHFGLKSYVGPTMSPVRLTWVGIGLPAGSKINNNGATYTLDLTDVPPLPDEPYSPPQNWMKAAVHFVYSSDADLAYSADDFWRHKAMDWQDGIDKFTSKHKQIDQEVARLLQPSDSSDAKLRKLYARAQLIRNTSYEREKSEKESKHENLKENENADDVLKRGYGSSWDVNVLFLAMAKSAGFDARYVRAASRDEKLFHKTVPDTSQLNAAVVLIKVGGKDMFFDPGTMYCPFGTLSWENTGVHALMAGHDGGQLIVTTQPVSSDAVTVRQASLRLDEGKLAGTVKVTFTGLEALRWRLAERENDETQRKKDLEDELSRWLPSGTTIDVLNVSGWTATDAPLVADFRVVIPNAVTTTGKRLLLSAGLFQSGDKHPFEHTERHLPVYFSYPFRETDDVTIEVPPGFKLEGVPQPKALQTDFGTYQRTAELADSRLRVQRRFVMEGWVFLTKVYPNIRSFYNTVRADDDEPLVMVKGVAP